MSLQNLINMASDLAKNSIKIIKPAPTKSEIFDALKHGKCPDCNNNEFFMGPKGGMCQNIQCVKCNNKFNLAPFEDGQWFGEPMLAERI